jgi:hypothetical protein
MKKKLYCYLLALSSLLTACDLGITETENILFTLNNTGVTTHEVIVYAKDQNRVLVDSSSRGGSLPGTKFSISITVPKLKDVEGGIFEIRAKAENGKLIVQEFGSINKPRKEKEYKIELRDSTIVFL